MSKMKVIKNAASQVINIGDWDYMYEEHIEQKPIDVNLVTLETDFEEYKPKVIKVTKNPLPEGAYEDIANVAVGPDGGLYLVDSIPTNQIG